MPYQDFLDSAPINLTAMSDPDDQDDEPTGIDFVDDTVIPDTNPTQSGQFPFQLLATVRILGEPVDCFD